MAIATDRYGIEVDSGNTLQVLDRIQQSVAKTAQVFGGLQSKLMQFAAGAFVANTLQSAKSLDDFAKSSGMSLKALTALTTAVKESGGTQDQAIDAFGQFAAKIREAAAGSKEAQDSFQKVGISLQDLQTLTQEELLTKAFQGLSKNQDSLSRLTLQMGVFGESFRVVRTGADGVASKLDMASEKAGRNADSIAKAAQSVRNFEKALSAVKGIILEAIEPITSLVAELEGIGVTASKIIKGLLQIGLVVVSFTLLGRVVTIARAAFVMLAEAFATLTAGAGVVVNLFRQWGAITGELAKIPLASRLKVVLELMKQLGEWLVTNIPVIGALGVALATLWDTLGDGIDAIKAYLGFGSEQVQQAQQQTQATEEQTKAEEERLKKLREIKDATDAERASLAASLKQYQLQNKLANDRYSLETKLISANEGYAERQRQLFELEANYQQERLKLQEQLDTKKKAAANSPTEAAMVPVIQDAMSKLDEAYKKQVAAVSGLSAARVKANQAYQLELFSVNSLVEAKRNLESLENQARNVLLPDLARRYKEIEDNARASALAAIAAEEARRKSTLSEAERNKYLEAAAQSVRELQAAEYELAKAQQQRRLIDFGASSAVESERRLREIQQEINTSIMPERSRLEKDLRFQAEERARAEIAAEEARRGPGYRMSEEEQQKYFAAATKGLEGIITKTQEHYDLQRKWSTGWKTAMQSYVEDVTNGARAAQRVFEKATQGMEDAIVNFAKTGKFEWKNFINSILEELLRSQLQQVIARTFGGPSSPSVIGQLIGGAGKLLGFANGGVIPTNGPVLVGERGPEIISGAAGRVVTPNEQLGGGTFVTYNINAVDAMSFKQMLARDPSFLYAVAEQGRRRLPGGRV